MPPMFVLQAATINAAQLLKHDKDLGSVTAGKLADVVAVDGDPLTDISVMKRVSFVMKAGVVTGRPPVERPQRRAIGRCDPASVLPVPSPKAASRARSQRPSASPVASPPARGVTDYWIIGGPADRGRARSPRLSPSRWPRARRSRSSRSVNCMGSGAGVGAAARSVVGGAAAAGAALGQWLEARQRQGPRLGQWFGGASTAGPRRGWHGCRPLRRSASPYVLISAHRCTRPR